MWSSSSAQQPGPDVRANINDDCIEGFFWPAGSSIDVTVWDSAGSVLHRFSGERADGSGHVIVAQRGDLCETPVDLRPDMKVTATDGDTSKVLVLERVTFDQLDPLGDSAAGTAPAGRSLDMFVYWNGLSSSVDAHPQADTSGDWSVDVGAIGGTVEDGSMGDVFLSDSDGDKTVADHFVTAVSLDASAPAGASAAVKVAAGTRIVLQGRLSAATRACVAHKRVRLLKVAGKQARLLRRGRTKRSGRYAFDRRVRKTTSFRVEYRGSRRCQRSTSRVREVRVER